MTNRTTPSIVLSVAGSDPSGGAGVQADIKTLTMIGVYGAAAITCLTVQNTQGVRSTHPVAADIVASQVRAVLLDMPVSHIKTGMIGNAAIAAALGEILADFHGELIVDPVLRATHGPALLDPAAMDVFRNGIVARATVLTPNRDELEILSGRPCNSENDLTDAARRLFDSFPRLRIIIAKGGHLATQASDVVDFLFARQHFSATGKPAAVSRRNRIATANSHGTGCTLASAFAGFHLLGNSDHEAFCLSAALIDQLLRKSAASRLGAGTGPLLHHLFVREALPK